MVTINAPWLAKFHTPNLLPKNSHFRSYLTAPCLTASASFLATLLEITKAPKQLKVVKA
jgi:hypothetical protein